jgi:hypothetical protein
LPVDEVSGEDEEQVDSDAAKVVEVNAKGVKASVAAVGQKHGKHGEAAESVEFGLLAGASVVREEVLEQGWLVTRD